MSIEGQMKTVQALVEFFARVDKQFKLRHMEMFLAIIRHKMESQDIPLTQQDLIERYDINTSTASRDVEYLGDTRGGLHLISTSRLSSNRKINEIHLTQKGEALKKKVCELLAS